MPGPAGPPAAGGARFAAVAPAEGTASTSFVALATPGPRVTVTVPASGTIMVAASVRAADGDGAVSLYEDGAPLAGQADACAGPAGTLFDAPAASVGAPGPFGTPGALGLAFCTTLGAPGFVVLQTTPGEHVYELRYAFCGCSGDPQVTFSDRRLWVAPVA